MKTLVEKFPLQLSEALAIADSTHIQSEANFHNVVISGLGGSGIGGTLIAELALSGAKIPISVNKQYDLPSFVNEKTLVIISSYSGNTEETLAAMQESIKRNATVVCITSGGKIKDLAKKEKKEWIEVPGGFPPRSCLGYSLVQILHILETKNIFHSRFKSQIKEGIALLQNELPIIQLEAQKVAEKLHCKTPVIYSLGTTEGIAIRFRQQLNENSKLLCWHHVIPEMNHNELVGWTEKNDKLAVCILRTDFDHPRNVMRLEINKQIISKCTPNLIEICGHGSTPLIQMLYLIHLTDWVSCYLADLQNIDPVEVKVIDFLKNELSK